MYASHQKKDLSTGFLKSVREMYYSMKRNLSKKTHKTNQPETQVPPPSKIIKPRD